MSELAISEVTTFPRRSTPERTQPESAGRILIIDDEAEIRESLETLLQLEGYTVVVAGSGREGLAHIGQRSFDVVLLDLALPDKNGMDVLSVFGAAPSATTGDHDHRVWDGGERGQRDAPALPTLSRNRGITKSCWPDVRAAVARQKAEEENIQLKRALKQRYNFENIVGKSEPMLKIFDLVAGRT